MAKKLPNPQDVIRDITTLLYPKYTEVTMNLNEIIALSKLIPKTASPFDRFTIRFAPTGVGDKITVSCHDDNGAVYLDKDISDYDSW